MKFILKDISLHTHVIFSLYYTVDITFLISNYAIDTTYGYS